MGRVLRGETLKRHVDFLCEWREKNPQIKGISDTSGLIEENCDGFFIIKLTCTLNCALVIIGPW